MSDQLDTQQPETSPAETVQSNPGLFGISANLFTAPTQAFEGIKQVGAGWFPLIIICVATALLYATYHQVVDFDWMITKMIEMETVDATPAERDMMEKSMGMFTNNVFMIMNIVGTLIGIPIIFAILAVYLIIVSNIRNDNLTYGQCFNLVCWSSMIKLTSILIGFVTLLLSENGQLLQNDFNGLHLNLLFNVDSTHAWYGWLTAFDLVGIWGAVLTGIGYRVFTKSSMTASMIIGFLPTVLIFGIFALFIS